MNILILYGSSEGQTEKIANYMADLITKQGHEVTTQSGKEVSANVALDAFDAVFIGASIHMGQYQSYIKKLVSQQRDRLNQLPSAFFSVCMAIHSKHAKGREEARGYEEKFLRDTGWQPRLRESFAGAVKYTQYNFITRFIMKMISKREGGSTDTTRDHEYTDWAKVAGFTQTFLEKLGA